MQPVYLDNNATTRPLDTVVQVFSAHFKEAWGNPGSGHIFGRSARRDLSGARRRIADRLGVAPAEVVITSGATEANNLALRGVFGDRGGHLVTTAVEHPAVLDCARRMERNGRCDLDVIGVDASGVLDLAALEASLRPGHTRLVSVMAANNETGVLFPLEEIRRITRDAGILLHVDAVQAIGRTEIDLVGLGADLVSLSAHKFHGPKGVGLLTVPRSLHLEPLLVGGGQERGRRSGTENPAAVVAMALALETALDSAAESLSRIAALRDRFERALLERIDGIRVTGAGAPRNANTSHLTVAGVEGEALLLRLDREGIACSVGSACSTGALEPSHVLRAMGVPDDRVHGALRFSLSRFSTEAEIERAVDVLPGIVAGLRALTTDRG